MRSSSNVHTMPIRTFDETVRPVFPRSLAVGAATSSKGEARLGGFFRLSGTGAVLSPQDGGRDRTRAVTDTVEKAGLCCREPGKAHKVETWVSGDPSRLNRKTVPIEDWQLYEREVEGIACRPYHVADPACSEIELPDERCAKAVALCRQDFLGRYHAGLGDVVVDRLNEGSFLRVRACKVVPQVGRHYEFAAFDSLQVTKQRDAIARELMQVERMSAHRPRDVRLACKLGSWRGQLIDAAIVESKLF